MNLLRNLKNGVEFMMEILRYLFLFLRAFFSSCATPAARIVGLQSQLAMSKNRIELRKDPKPRFTSAFRILCVVLSKVLAGRDDLAQPMKPATVKRWHAIGFRFYWPWKSRPRIGRSPISQEMQDLIRKLSRENPLWGAERIVERFVGTLRRELLDYVIVLSQRHLERLLKEFIEEYYHTARPHQGLNGDTPIAQEKLSKITGPGKLISVPVLGGLHGRYQRVAA